MSGHVRKILEHAHKAGAIKTDQHKPQFEEEGGKERKYESRPNPNQIRWRQGDQQETKRVCAGPDEDTKDVETLPGSTQKTQDKENKQKKKQNREKKQKQIEDK